MDVPYTNPGSPLMPRQLDYHTFSDTGTIYVQDFYFGNLALIGDIEKFQSVADNRLAFFNIQTDSNIVYIF